MPFQGNSDMPCEGEVVAYNTVLIYSCCIMRCRVIRMRQAGVAVPKYALKERASWAGELSILDMRDDGVNRVIKTARLVDESFADKRIQVLFEPHIVWMNEGRFTLQGFERVLQEGRVVEYAQSWLCTVETGEV